MNTEKMQFTDDFATKSAIFFSDEMALFILFLL